MRILTVIIWAAIILVVISIALFFPTLLTIDSRYAIAIDQTRRLEQGGINIRPVDVLELQGRTNILKGKLAAVLPPTPIEYIEHIRLRGTNGIQLNGFSLSNANAPIIEVTGIATTRQNLQYFIDALKADTAIVTVDSPVTNFVKSNQSEFKITVTFKSV